MALHCACTCTWTLFMFVFVKIWIGGFGGMSPDASVFTSGFAQFCKVATSRHLQSTFANYSH